MKYGIRYYPNTRPISAKVGQKCWYVNYNGDIQQAIITEIEDWCNIYTKHTYGSNYRNYSYKRTDFSVYYWIRILGTKLPKGFRMSNKRFYNERLWGYGFIGHSLSLGDNLFLSKNEAMSASFLFRRGNIHPFV